MAYQTVLFRAVLLVGLLAVGLVERDAAADPVPLADFAPSGEVTLENIDALESPPMVRLLAETLDGTRAWDIYFPSRQVILTAEAQLVLREILLDLDRMGAVTITLEGNDADPMLGWERLQTLADALEHHGYTAAAPDAVSWLETDIIHGL